MTLLVAIFSHGIARISAEYLWFQTSDLYGEAMYIVTSSPDVAKRLGTPVVASWPLVRRSVYRQVGQVSARMRVGGPLGAATVHLRAKTRGGTWEFQQLEARVDSDGASIDLMPHPWSPQKLVLRGSGRLYFVGIGQLSRLDVDELARSYSDRYEVHITVLPSLPYEARRERAHQMIHLLKGAFPDLAADPQAVIIAVTEVDMDWYSWRDDGRFAVVSTAGLTSDQFRKQVSKCLGLLWFELPMSADSRSVLYDAVGSSVDLDLMSDDF